MQLWSMKVLYPKAYGVNANFKSTLKDLEELIPGIANNKREVIYDFLDVDGLKNAKLLNSPNPYDYVIAAGRLV
jgi:hypothetical protein